MYLKWMLPWLGALLLLSAVPLRPSAKKKASENSSREGGPPARVTRSASRAKLAGSAAINKARVSRRGRRERGQKAPTASRIEEIQAALAREGTYAGEPSGKWDTASVEAMKRFQVAHGLNPTGKIDALSLQKLGLGSGVAGRAAPRTPVQSSAGKVAPPD